MDPLTKDYPELTTYQYSSNCPIACIDLDGLEGAANTGFGSDPMATFAYQMSSYLEAAASWLDVTIQNTSELFLSPFVREKTVGTTTITEKKGSTVTTNVTATITPSKLFNKSSYSNNTYAAGKVIEIKAVLNNDIKVVNSTSTVLTPTTTVVRSTSVSTTISSTNPENIGKITVENKLSVNTNVNGVPVTGTGKTQTTTGNGTSTSETSISIGVGNDNNNVSVGGTSCNDNSTSVNVSINLGLQSQFVEVSSSTSVAKTIPSTVIP